MPYARILDRASLSGIESIITAAIRIYVSVAFIKSMATFTKFYPKFPDVFSSIYASYIIEVMEESFKDAQGARWEGMNPFKDNDFWYAFLEQSVQLYSRRVDSGEISDPPQAAIDALVHLNDMQEEYPYPSKEDREDARDDKEFGWLKYRGKWGLKKYRQTKNLDAVYKTADYAKVALKELVVEQLNQTGEKFIENLEILDMQPDIQDLDYYLLNNLTQGGQDLTLSEEIRETYTDFPSYDDDDTDGHYTDGNEFALPDGTEYVGYYHVARVYAADEPSDSQYRTGAESGDAVEYQILTPFASKVIVPIGDVASLGEYSLTTDETNTTMPFIIEKYMKITTGTARMGFSSSYYAPADALSDVILYNDDLTQNISDVYPGTLSFVLDSNGAVVGLDGELGVRHGLRFSVIIDDTPYTVTEVEVDAIDVALEKIQIAAADSKLLLCLINLLKADEKFQLVTQYVFPLKKLTSIIAIYNGLAFLPSIGEKVGADGDTYNKSSIYDNDGADAKKAAGVNITFVDTDGETPLDTPLIYDSPVNPGSWSSKVDRDPGRFGALFVQEWDAWDKTLLRNSKGRIKKIFKGYYNARQFSPGDSTYESPGDIISAEFKERFKSRPGQDLLPWWRKRLLRTNPFNADGEMCEEKD